MRDGIVIGSEEIKTILADYFGVPYKDVIRSQYSYIVIGAKAQEILSIKRQTEKT